MRARSARFVVVLALAGLSCTPSQGGGGGNGFSDAPTGDGAHNDGATGDGISVVDACTQLATAKCTKLMSCSMTDLERKFTSINECEARELLTCQDAQTAPDTSATPAQAIACGMALTAESCTAFLGATAPAACLPAAGPGAGGCAFGGECSTAFCAIGAEALCGQCRTQPTVGTSCAAADCANGQICADGNLQCVLPGTLASACNPNLPCGDGFTCVGRTANTNGACQAELTTIGATCDANHNQHADCSADDGLACNTQTKQCVALGLAAAGSPCGLVNNAKTVCTGGAECITPAGKTAGTCITAAADGGACNVATGPDCLTPSRCIVTAGSAGTCQLPGSMTCQ